MEQDRQVNVKHILIVDDEARVAFFLREGLCGLGDEYKVDIAKSAESALERMRCQPFDLLVVDLRLPGISGLDLLKRARDTSPYTKTILITAYGSPEIEREAYRLNAYRYLHKPFRIEELMGTVQSLF